ncbi:MAG: DEAD/DEAH box helicase [Chitinophagaceae bacterium]|nr:MAG: DEAD/DEAH box helicase [Chitinophagaceae bacterium]
MQAKSLDIPQVLANLNIESLNEMQLRSLDANRENRDLVLLSATGSGKTLAFLLPILERLDPAEKGTQALIVVPSRELALQIEQVFKTMGTGYKITCTYGGHKREIEENNLIQAPAVIVGTPGRIGDHLRRENIKPKTIRTLVLDEFDKSLEMGFQEEMAFILKSLPSIEKKILTSATAAHEIPEFIGLDNEELLDFLPADGVVKDMLAIQQVTSPDKDKLETLFRLLCLLNNRSAIVFCNHRESVERVSEWLKEKDIVNVFYHGSLEQHDREVALCKFRNGSSSVLVTTDLAARGLDIDNIRYIVHYHLPSSEDVYTHRNGRTARMDASGTVILIIGPDEKKPKYITEEPELITLPEETEIPEKPKWTTLFIGAGKKDKINKIDIVGFLSNRGELKKEDIGLVEVKDFTSFVAIRKTKATHTLHLVQDHRLKNKKIKVAAAK